jgi:hypothetical protein
MKKVFIFAFFLLSCTHWLIETQTRIQVENLTDEIISDLSIVSKNEQEIENKQKITLVPGNIESREKSKVYEVELVGEFNFEVHYGDSLVPLPLGTHKLKGGSVLAQIKKENGKLIMVLK